MESTPATSAIAIVWQGLPSIRIARKGTLALGIKLAGAGLALALQISLARMLGHTGYGDYAYVFAWLQLMLIFAQAGFSTAALRFVAEYHARRQATLVRGFLTRSSQIVLIKSVVLAMLMAGCAVALSRSESANMLRSFLVASAALPVLAQFMLRSAFVRGLGRVIPSMLVGLAQPVLLLGTLLFIAFHFRIQISSCDVLLLNLGAAVCALGMIVAIQRHFQRNMDQASQCEFQTGEWLSTATCMMFASGLIYLQGRTGVIISGLLLDASDAGTYAAIERLADATLLGLASVNLLAAPKFAALYAQGRQRELQRFVRLAAWGSSGFMLATVLPLVLFGKPILRLFGDGFVAGYPVLLVLLGGVAVNAMCGSVGLLLSMTGHHRDTVIVAFCCVCANLLLSLILIPRYGILGTSMAFAASMALWNVSMLLMVRRKLGIWSNLGRLESTRLV